MENFFNIGNNNFKVKATAVFQTLDAKDGKNDGKISASIWNEFADKVGGKHINEFITEQNAVRSIKTYLKRGGEIVKQAIYEYLGWSTDKAHQRFNAAENMLEDAAKAPSNMEITKDKNNKSKEATLPDGRAIRVYYNKDNKIEKIYVSTEVGIDNIKLPNKHVEFDDSEVGFFADGKQVDAEKTNQKNCKYDLTVTEGYEFEKYKKLAEKIFGSSFDD